MRNTFDMVAAIGDVSDSRTWSGIPFHFWRTAQRMGRTVQPWRLDLSSYRGARRAWNLRRSLTGRGLGGYQYSKEFLDRAEREMFAAQDCREKTILSFSHQFPRAKSVRAAGGRVVYYLDATLAAMLDGHALHIRLPRRTGQEALEIERENLANAHHVVTMARWLRDYLVEHNHVALQRISVVLPGANLELPEAWQPSRWKGGARNKPFVLGLVGNDWRRKGLPLLVDVARRLLVRGLSVTILVIGNAPKGLATDCAHVLGPVDKGKQQPRFIDALQQCDLGCLFSEREALGISLLEFLRVGVPVAGFTHEGPLDSIPPDAGLRFENGTPADAIAAEMEKYITSGERQRACRAAAAEWSGRMTWERCIRELDEQLDTGRVTNPAQPWRGLPKARLRSGLLEGGGSGRRWQET